MTTLLKALNLTCWVFGLWGLIAAALLGSLPLAGVGVGTLIAAVVCSAVLMRLADRAAAQEEQRQLAPELC